MSEPGPSSRSYIYHFEVRDGTSAAEQSGIYVPSLPVGKHAKVRKVWASFQAYGTQASSGQSAIIIADGNALADPELAVLDGFQFSWETTATKVVVSENSPHHDLDVICDNGLLVYVNHRRRAGAEVDLTIDVYVMVEFVDWTAGFAPAEKHTIDPV
jgi:hypothetical protein